MPFSSLSPLAQRLVGFATLLPVIALVWFDAGIASLVVWLAFILMGSELGRLVELPRSFVFLMVILFAFVGMPLWFMVIGAEIILAVIVGAMIMVMWQTSFPIAAFVGLVMLCGVSAQVIISLVTAKTTFPTAKFGNRGVKIGCSKIRPINLAKIQFGVG